MTTGREYVMLDEFGKYDDVKLAEVIGALETESNEALAELREELQRRTLAALERAAKAGVVLASRPPAAAGAAPKKRGPKPKQQAAADVELEDDDDADVRAEPSAISGRA